MFALKQKIVRSEYLKAPQIAGPFDSSAIIVAPITVQYHQLVS